jgi:hypothetical protein
MILPEIPFPKGTNILGVMGGGIFQHKTQASNIPIFRQVETDGINKKYPAFRFFLRLTAAFWGLSGGTRMLRDFSN